MNVEVEYALPAGAWEIRPLVGLRHSRGTEDGFVETGNAATALTVAARRNESTTASAGARFLHPFSSGLGGVELRAALSRLFGANDAPLSASLAGQAGAFSVHGTPLQRNALTLAAGVNKRLSSRLSGYADASYEVRGAGQTHLALVAGLRMGW